MAGDDVAREELHQLTQRDLARLRALLQCACARQQARMSAPVCFEASVAFFLQNGFLVGEMFRDVLQKRIERRVERGTVATRIERNADDAICELEQFGNAANLWCGRRIRMLRTIAMP